jgi:membrane dipeptidase
MGHNADRLHIDSLIFDGHCDTILALRGRQPGSGRRLGERSTQGELDLPRMQDGGVGAQVFACYVRPEFRYAGAAAETLRMIDTLYQELDANADQVALVTTAGAIEEARSQGKVAAMLAIEGGEALEESLEVLRSFHRLGVRLITLTWNYRNALADGVGALRSGGGLTEFGVQVVEEMNRLGMLVDIAHLSPQGVADVAAISEAPFVDSHANARALCDHPRNLTDAQLEALAASGGVVGVSFVPLFVSPKGAGASLSKVVDHIDHIVQVVGADHVGLGSDWDGISGSLRVAGLEDVTKVPGITRELAARGYSEEAIRQILGGNWLRVWRDVAG